MLLVNACACECVCVSFCACVCVLQAELARWMGAELIRAAVFDKMRDAMKSDMDKMFQVGTWWWW